MKRAHRVRAARNRAPPQRADGTPAARRPPGSCSQHPRQARQPPAQENAAVDVPDEASELRMGDTATFPGLPHSGLPAPDALLGHTSPAREELLENAKEKATAHS